MTARPTTLAAALADLDREMVRAEDYRAELAVATELLSRTSEAHARLATEHKFARQEIEALRDRLTTINRNYQSLIAERDTWRARAGQ